MSLTNFSVHTELGCPDKSKPVRKNLVRLSLDMIIQELKLGGPSLRTEKEI